MSDPKTQQEPSMEEILASIRRIISEDADQKPAAPAAGKAAEPMRSPPAGDDVLTLTDRVDDGDVGHAREPEPLFHFDHDPEPEPDHHHDHDEPDFGDSLMSRTAASSAADAFSQLREMSEPDLPHGGGAPVVIDGSANNVLEAIIREAVKPILKDWLDRNLPGIVEDLVRAEIQRVAQGPGGRRR